MMLGFVLGFAWPAERSRPRAGAWLRTTAAVGLRPTPLRCSVAWPAAELASFAALKQTAASQITKRAARAATRPALLGAAHARSQAPARGLAWDVEGVAS